MAFQDWPLEVGSAILLHIRRRRRTFRCRSFDRKQRISGDQMMDHQFGPQTKNCGDPVSQEILSLGNCVARKYCRNCVALIKRSDHIS